MSKPAARLTDMTAHGGIITAPGAPLVLIGGLPAARVTDMHVCPMVTGVVPHVGGPIILGSFGVFTMNMPQARIGDMCICVGPPDIIVKGQPDVLVGEIMPGSAVSPAAVVLVPTPGMAPPGGGAAGTPQGMTMSAAKQAGTPFTKTDCNS